MTENDTNQQAFKEAELILKHLRGETTEMEEAALSKWLAEDPRNQLLLDSLNQENALKEELDFFQSVDVPKDLKAVKSRLPVYRSGLLYKLGQWKYAAMFLLAASIGLAIYQHEKKISPESAVNSKAVFRHDILPGGNKAILTLANGKQIVLNNVHNGLIANQGHVDIHKSVDGRVTYESKQSADSQEAGYNTISTPTGGQYSIVLPDGSKVWLNPKSSLRFPTEFNGEERTVELTGEAYFEIAKIKNGSGRGIKRIPFMVKANNVSVEVLGTHFNVMAYANENTINTTLLEGSVKVSSGKNSKIIVPGQQALAGSSIILEDVDVNEAVAWKNGFFQFNNADLPSIMRQIERWYDVKVIYEDHFYDKHYSGVMPRNDNVSALLKMLEMAGKVHFKIEGKEIRVMK